MHYILDRGYRLWAWLLQDSRATAILVFITAWYAILTWRMTQAVARQTRATIQPVALLEFHWKNEKYYPASYFEIKNLGTQPLLLLDVKLWCSCGIAKRRNFTQHYTLWDEHIIPPGESLRPKFDFKHQFENEKLQWSCVSLSYSLEVVASDLSKQVVLTYRNIPVLSLVNVDKGMPLSVRRRYFVKRIARRYYGLLYRFRRLKTGE
jgi:hypothetical protein